MAETVLHFGTSVNVKNIIAQAIAVVEGGLADGFNGTVVAKSPLHSLTSGQNVKSPDFVNHVPRAIRRRFIRSES